METQQIKIAPSILSADFRRLEEEVKAVQDAGADMIHCDVMDGTFVPNITFGPFVVEAVKKSVSIPLDVHLMIVNPEKYVASFRDAGADIITVHAEACKDLGTVLTLVRESGAKVGITINPDKPVDLFIDHIDQIDQVMIMSVFAGFSGQKFINGSLTKVKQVYEEVRRLNKTCDIEIDGGINGETAQWAAQSGVNVFVAGNFVFKSDNYAKQITAIRESAQIGQTNLKNLQQ